MYGQSCIVTGCSDGARAARGAALKSAQYKAAPIPPFPRSGREGRFSTLQARKRVAHPALPPLGRGKEVLGRKDPLPFLQSPNKCGGGGGVLPLLPTRIEVGKQVARTSPFNTCL